MSKGESAGTARATKGRVLVVDDSEVNRNILAAELRHAGFEVATAHCGEAGLQEARTFHPWVIILDIGMPDISGIEVCRRLKSDPLLEHIPVVFLTAQGQDEALTVSALNAGGNDFLEKPYSSAVLVARISSQASIYAAQARLRDLLITDELTGVFSRRYLFEFLRQQLKQLIRGEGGCLSVLMLDLDHFKKINDTVGHVEGDRVLRQVGQLLRQLTRGSDVVARYGGEEFVVVLPETGPEGAAIVAQKLGAGISGHPWDGVAVTISQGVAWYQNSQDSRSSVALDSDATIEALLERADRALYRSKRGGRNRASTQDEAD